MTHSQVNKGVDGKPPHHESVMASSIARPEPQRKPLECDQVEDGWSQAIKQS